MAFKLAEGYIDLGLRTKHFDSAIGRVNRILGGVSSKMNAVSRTAKRTFLAAGAAAGVSLKAYGSFDKAMRKATAVSDVTEKQFAKMSAMAEKQSIRLNMAATKTAEAFYFLGSAGLSVKEQMDAYIPTATLAKAATIEMGAAAEMVVDTMKGFQIGFENTTHVTDVMAKAVISSNMTFSQLGETLALVSGVARSTNNSLEETIAMIATMADVGLKGSRAGTSLRRALLNIAAPTSAITKTLRHYGIEVYDANGKMKPFIRLVGEISEKLENATEAERNMAFRVMFGARAIAGQIAIFDKGREALEAFTKALENAGGTAEKVAKKQMGFSDKVMQTWRKIETLTRHVGEFLAPAFLRLSDAVGKVTEKLTKFIDKHRRYIQEWGEKTAARINFVQNLLVEFAKFMYTDFPKGVRFALDAVLEVFKAFGKSLIVVMEKVGKETANRFLEPLGKPLTKKLTEWFTSFYAKSEEKGGYYGYVTMTGREKIAAMERVRKKTEERMKWLEEQGAFNEPLYGFKTASWEEVGKKIIEIYEKAAEKIDKITPPKLGETYERERIKIAKTLAIIEAKYAIERLKDRLRNLGELVAEQFKPLQRMYEYLFGGKATDKWKKLPTLPTREPTKFSFVGIEEAWKSFVSSLTEKKDETSEAILKEQEKTTEEVKKVNQSQQTTNKSLLSIAKDIATEIIGSGLGTVGP